MCVLLRMLMTLSLLHFVHLQTMVSPTFVFKNIDQLGERMANLKHDEKKQRGGLQKKGDRFLKRRSRAERHTGKGSLGQQKLQWDRDGEKPSGPSQGTCPKFCSPLGNESHFMILKERKCPCGMNTMGRLLREKKKRNGTFCQRQGLGCILLTPHTLASSQGVT